jgi:hypothetical protein
MHVTVFGSLLQRMVYYACSLYGSRDAPRSRKTIREKMRFPQNPCVHRRHAGLSRNSPSYACQKRPSSPSFLSQPY